MAKSLRSNKVQKNKTIKRQTTFGDVAAARERRIAERLHNAAYEKVLESQHKPEDSEDPSQSAGQDETQMEVEVPDAEQKPRFKGLGTNLNKKRREERKAKSKRGSKKKNRK